jgi:hypothetical protein
MATSPCLHALVEAAGRIECARRASKESRVISRLVLHIEAVEALQSQIACGLKVARRLRKDLPGVLDATPEDSAAVSLAIKDWTKEAASVRYRLHTLRKQRRCTPTIPMRAAAPEDVRRERRRLQKRRERAAPHEREDAEADLANTDEAMQTRRVKVRRNAEQYIAYAASVTENPEETWKFFEAACEKVRNML